MTKNLKNFSSHEISMFQNSIKEEIDIFFLRTDGILIYHSTKSSNAQPLGALFCGVGEATKAILQLLNFTSSKDHYSDFKFSIENSNSGIYLVPIHYEDHAYFLAFHFKSVLNPGKLKNLVRIFAAKFEASLKQLLENEKIEVVQIDNQDDFLFDNISDEEIDNLFSFVGG